jgi:hypothetical protein
MTTADITTYTVRTADTSFTVTTADIKTHAIFATDHGQTSTLQYVAEGADAEEAFSAFDNDVLSDTGEEAGWVWHVYEIPSEIADDDDAIYDYVASRFPTKTTS